MFSGLILLGVLPALGGAEEAPLPPIPISRAAGPIVVDGDLSDPGWSGASRVETWFETNPGDDVPPKVHNVGYVAYDDKYFYAAFEFDDPDPARILAPVADHDNVPFYTDYGGVILDTRNNGRTGMLFLANPAGVQYDAISDDGSGEDSSPDFYWDAAARITEKGWQLELRIPFSTLRYPKANPQTWGIMLYRNWPREFRYQIFSTRLPQGGSCFICRENKLVGLSDLPSGNHAVFAPYMAGRQTARPPGDVLGAPLENGPVHGDLGFDAKWMPGANTAVDATVNPDFSQIESDVAQIAANERFALLFPEKRPFFLEGIDLLSTPIQAVYTRTITSPRFGLRTTGKLGQEAYTALVAYDRGGGSAILPGPNSSDLADQDFGSWVALGRVRREMGKSSASFLMTDREFDGGGYNRVLGPDFQWRPNEKDTVTGQFLLSRSETPNRPLVAAEWDGRRLASHAADAWWNHSTKTFDLTTEYKDFGGEFRADDGFVPQVGYRENYTEAGYTFRPQGWVRRLRTFAIFDYSRDRASAVLTRTVSLGFGMDARWNSFVRLRYAHDDVRAGAATLPRQQFVYTIQASPSRVVSRVSLDGFLGEDVDFDGARRGRGGKVSLEAFLRPTTHLELHLNEARRWLTLGPPDVPASTRLFSARVDRLGATYSFTARCFLRAIGQWVETRREAALFPDAVDARDGDLTLSALFAYKVNWQTVLFAGYGDDRALDDTQDLARQQLARQDRQLFVKLSYAWQR